MRCNKCGKQTEAFETTPAIWFRHHIVRRRRSCPMCGYIEATYELPMRLFAHLLDADPHIKAVEHLLDSWQTTVEMIRLGMTPGGFTWNKDGYASVLKSGAHV